VLAEEYSNFQTLLGSPTDRKKARDWEEKRSRRQTHIHQPINGNVGNVIGNINGTINFKTSSATSKRGLNREKVLMCIFQL
jgi:hypothetical protein